MRNKTYRSWEAMKRRCLNSKDYQYKRYSKLGMEEDWKSYKNFLSDSGERPEGTTLDRINNDLGYFRGNIRWATPTMQARNTKQTLMLTNEGITKPLGDWADDLKISPQTLWARLYSMDVASAVTRPLRKKKE